jgi:alpha-tubulin suppressor-like RCC1 family protein
MPTFYNFRQNGLDYSFDDIFVPADLFREGTLWTWGRGSQAQLGNAQTTNRSTPVTTFAGGNNWKQVSCGQYVTSAIKTDGTLWIWGYAPFWQLGNGAITGNRSTPVTTFAGGTNWKQVSIGIRNTAAIKTDGTLWTWGLGSYGRLGNAQITNRSTPVTTFAGGTNWKQVSCGYTHVAAIKTDGTLWTWGRGALGSLGTNNVTDRSTPVTTFAGGNNWKQVSCGQYMTSAIKTDGTLWIWGAGNLGKLGTNDYNNQFTPVTTFAGGTNWKQVTATGYSTAAVKTDGTLWIWGRNNLGQSGNFSTNVSSTPVTTFAGGNNWKQVSAGASNTAAIKTDGTLWTWGSGSYGQLGNAQITDRSTPVTTFAGRTNWKQVSCGDFHLAAVTYEDPVL